MKKMKTWFDLMLKPVERLKECERDQNYSFFYDVRNEYSCITMRIWNWCGPRFSLSRWMCYSYYSLAQVDHNTTVVASIRHNIHIRMHFCWDEFSFLSNFMFSIFLGMVFSSSTIPSRIVLCRRIQLEEKVSCLLHSNTLLLEWELIRFAATKHELHDILLEIQKNEENTFGYLCVWVSPSANDAQKLVQEYGKMRSREKCIEIYKMKMKWLKYIQSTCLLRMYLTCTSWKYQIHNHDTHEHILSHTQNMLGKKYVLMHWKYGICAEICSWQFLHRSQVVFLAYISIITRPIQAVAVSKSFW